MATIEELKKARKLAEDAVADMPEGELKTKAFEVILNDLLSKRPRQKGKKRPRKPTRPPMKEEIPKIPITEEDIGSLKERIESLGKIAGNRAALEIANFLLQDKGVENFSPENLIDCYTLLKKARVPNIPPIANMPQLLRDVYNKGWFDKNDDGTYKISSLGHHFLSKEEVKRSE